MCMQGFGLKAEPPPDPPLIASTPDRFAWTINVEWKARQKHTPDPTQTDSSRRLANIYPLLVRDDGGKGW